MLIRLYIIIQVDIQVDLENKNSQPNTVSNKYFVLIGQIWKNHTPQLYHP